MPMQLPDAPVSPEGPPPRSPPKPHAPAPSLGLVAEEVQCSPWAVLDEGSASLALGRGMSGGARGSSCGMTCGGPGPRAAGAVDVAPPAATAPPLLPDNALRSQLREDVALVVHGEMQQLREWLSQQLQPGGRLEECSMPSAFGSGSGSSTERCDFARIGIDETQRAQRGWSDDVPSKKPDGVSFSRRAPHSEVSTGPPTPGRSQSGDLEDNEEDDLEDPSQDRPAKRVLRRSKCLEDEAANEWSAAMAKEIEERLALTRAKTFTCCEHVAAWAEPPDNCMTRLAQKNWFNYFFSALIVINTAMIGIETEVCMHRILENPNAEAPTAFRFMSITFTTLFGIELVIKIVGLRLAFFCGSGWRWNVFDAFLVAISLLQEVMDGTNVSFIRILRVFRMIRVLRILRVLRVFHELRRMAASIISALSSLSWAFLLLLLIMYIFAIFFMQGAATWISSNPREVDHIDSIADCYGSLFKSMVSLIKAISGGDDWGNIVEPITVVSDWYLIAFIMYIIFVVFGVLNVLTGVFLESAAQIVDRDLITQNELHRQNNFTREMGSLFAELDKDNSGTLNWEEFQEHLKDARVRAYLNSQHLDSNDGHMFFKILQSQAGLENGGEIPIRDFILGCARLKGQAKSMHVLNLELEMQNLKHLVAESSSGLQEQLIEVSSGLQRLSEVRPWVKPSQLGS